MGRPRMKLYNFQKPLLSPCVFHFFHIYIFLSGDYLKTLLYTACIQMTINNVYSLASKTIICTCQTPFLIACPFVSSQLYVIFISTKITSQYISQIYYT